MCNCCSEKLEELVSFMYQFEVLVICLNKEYYKHIIWLRPVQFFLLQSFSTEQGCSQTPNFKWGLQSFLRGISVNLPIL